MREINGIADATKMQAGPEPTHRVTITDGRDGLVILCISDQTYPAGLTPDRARFIAKKLVESAARVEKANVGRSTVADQN